MEKKKRVVEIQVQFTVLERDVYIVRLNEEFLFTSINLARNGEMANIISHYH